MAVMLCQAKGDTAGQCPHGCASLPGGGHEASVFKEQGEDNSQIGWHQDEILSIFSLLVSTSLGSMF